MPKIYLYLLVFSVFFIQLSSCITARKVNYLQEPNNIIPTYSDTVLYEEYNIRTGDKIYVRVYSTHEETNDLFNAPGNQISMLNQGGDNVMTDLYAYTVQENGCISFPMIGEVLVLGMTTRDATRRLENAIKPLYQFSTVEMRILNRYFSVIGGGHSGYYPIEREKINIFQALAMAGDVGVYADRSKVRIVRETEKGTIVKVFDVRSRDIINSEFYYIEPNDVIYIQTLDEQFFSILNFPTLLATVISTFSFGAFLFNIIFASGSN